MSPIFTLTKSALKMFVRNRQALFFTLFTPLIIMGIFGLIGFDRPSKINIGIVSQNPNAPTTQFIEQLKSVPNFKITEGDQDQETKALNEDERSVVLIIPGDYLPENPQISAARSLIAKTNASDQNAAIAISELSQILDKTNLKISGAQEVLKIDEQKVNVKNLTYIDFLLPGIVALAIMQMSVFSVAFVFADYKEKGILKRVLATPVKPYEFVAANVITRLLVSLAQATILIAVGVLAFKAHVTGSYGLILLVVLLGATMFLGLGFTISGLASTVESVPALANLVVFPMLFLGGTFFPLSSMPQWLQNIAKFLPLTYFSDSMRQVMTKNAHFADIQNNLLWMLGWCVVLIFLANLTFSFEEKRV